MGGFIGERGMLVRDFAGEGGTRTCEALTWGLGGEVDALIWGLGGVEWNGDGASPPNRLLALGGSLENDSWA